jgi:Transposase zinc-ribbon domain
LKPQINMKQFKNLNEVITYFSNEDKCRDTLEQMRWPDGRIVCPKCGVKGAYRMGIARSISARIKSAGASLVSRWGRCLKAQNYP